jgi:hypothetical protein
MKNVCLTTLVVLITFLSLQVTAQQNYSIGQFYEGYIINKDGTKTDGFIRYGSMAANKSNIEFYTDKTNRKTKQTLNPKEIAGYKVGSEEYHSFKYGVIVKEQVFGRLDTDGHIKVYGVAELTQLENDGDAMEFMMVLKKGDEEAIGTARFIRFAKEMSELVSDHKELSKKIEDKEKGYRLIDMQAIIKEYNDWYAANH